MGKKNKAKVIRKRNQPSGEEAKRIQAVADRLGISSLDMSHLRLKESEDDYKWGELKSIYKDISKSIVYQLAMCNAALEQYKDLLAKPENKDVVQTLLGLVNSFKDLADDLANEASKHSSVNADGSFNFKEGCVSLDDTDGKFDYIGIAGAYAAIGEKVNRLASVGFLDVISKIQTLDTNLANDPAVEKAKNELKEMTKVEGLDKLTNTISTLKDLHEKTKDK